MRCFRNRKAWTSSFLWNQSLWEMRFSLKCGHTHCNETLYYPAEVVRNKKVMLLNLFRAEIHIICCHQTHKCESVCLWGKNNESWNYTYDQSKCTRIKASGLAESGKHFEQRSTLEDWLHFLIYPYKTVMNVWTEFVSHCMASFSLSLSEIHKQMHTCTHTHTHTHTQSDNVLSLSLTGMPSSWTGFTWTD